MFVHQVTQILLRHALGGEATAMQARAAEMLFRPQRISVQDDGQVMAADDEAVQRHAISANFGAIGELLKQGGAALRTAELDVLREDNQEIYWERDESHDLVVSLNHGQPALAALCRVLEAWVRHFLGTAVRIEAARSIDDENWVWHVGLDAQASAVLNDLYRGEDVNEDRMAAHAVPVPARLRGAGRHAARNRRPSGVPGDGDGRRAPPEAQAAKPAAQSASGAAVLKPRQPCKVPCRPQIPTIPVSYSYSKDKRTAWFRTSITALTGPINELEQRVLDSMPAIERWFRLEWMEHTPPFYSSVDIRNAGFKLAPVDTNLYPGGWNNLTPEMLPLAVQSAMAAIEKICPEAKNLLVIPENHTRNTFYLSNLAQLKRIFHMAGLNVRIGSINPDDQGADHDRAARRRDRWCSSRWCAASAGWA